MWLLECHRIHFKYSKLFWSLWSFFAFEKRRLLFLFRRITSIKQPKCFTLERLNHRNACSDTHACNTFISAPACLCNISVSYYYLKFANLEHDLGCMAHWEFAGSERKWTQVSVSEPQRETCWLPTLHIETLDQSLTPTNTYKRYTGNKGNNTFTYFSLHSENKQANKRINDWCHFAPVSTQDVLCITTVTLWTWGHQQQREHISFLDFNKDRSDPCCMGLQWSRQQIQSLKHWQWLRKRRQNKCYLHILLPEQWGPT